MKHEKIIVASRASKLAVEQTLQACQKMFDSKESYDIQTIVSRGDKNLNIPFQAFDQKSIFSKELDEALLNQSCDIAVHSYKDLTNDFPKGIELLSLLNTEDPRDCFVSVQYKKLEDMPAGSVIGTGSVRRYTVLKKYYPHLKVKAIRGNIHTRIEKQEQGEYDAIVLSAAGLIRMGMQNKIQSYLDPFIFTPPIGQGLIAVCCLSEHKKTVQKRLTLQQSQFEIEKNKCIQKIRDFMIGFEGACSLPLGAQLLYDQNKLTALYFYLGDATNNEEIRLRLEGDDIDAILHNLKINLKKNNAQSYIDNMKHYIVKFDVE